MFTTRPMLLSNLIVLAGCVGTVREPDPPIATRPNMEASAGADRTSARDVGSRWTRHASPQVASSSWPAPAQFEATRASLGRPLTLMRVRHDDHDAVALARRGERGLELFAVVDGEWDTESLCGSPPCDWPTVLVAQDPFIEPEQLPEAFLDDIAYAHTLRSFEGPLSIGPESRSYDDSQGTPVNLPESAWSIDMSAPNLPDLASHLETLRRFHPMGYCSMDQRPQQAALMRAIAAAQAGRTGWAVQGWTDTVGYWSSSRMAASTYGASHPSGHVRLLEMVGVDPERLLLGFLLEVHGAPRHLGLSDIRRVVPDLRPAVASRLRVLASDARIDPLNRALLTAAVGTLPLTNDPLYAALPDTARALIDSW